MNRGILLICLAVSSLATGSRADDDDDEVRQAQGRLAMQNNCLMCHGAPIIVSQRLSAEQWKTEVTKMVGWGAPLPENEQAVLLEYLTKEFGAKVAKVRPARVTIRHAESAIDSQNDSGGVAIRAGDRERGQKLFDENCAKCHGDRAQGGEIGVNLLERPILDRWADFRTIVQDGRNRMPGFRQALDRGAERDILWWLETTTARPR